MNAPEQCPVCGAACTYSGKMNDNGLEQRKFDCHAMWIEQEIPGGIWVWPCPHAMTACLRTGATLTATPLEQSEKALLRADLGVLQANAEWDAAFESDDIDGNALEPYTENVKAARNVWHEAVERYRTALDGAK